MSDYPEIKIIFSDIDGTLLPWSGKDLTATAALIGRLIEAGCIFVPCTGRGTGNIPDAIRNVPGLRYAITGNGAFITDLTTGKQLYRRLLSAPLSRQLTLWLRGYDGNSYLYRKGEHFLDVTPQHPAPSSLPGTLSDWLASAHFSDFTELLSEPESEWIDKMGFRVGSAAVRSALQKDIRQTDFYHEVLVSSSGTWNIEINAAGGSKGNAALWLCRELGLSPDQMLACGDNYNDLSMLEAAHLAVCPSGAVDEVKLVSHVITPPAEEDGVERFLARLLPGRSVF